MAFLFFNADRDGFDDGEGNLVSLGDHLDYLANQGGTPDCWSSTETESLAKAKLEAMESGLHLYIVCEYKHRVVGIVNKPVEIEKN